jgi:hypothetical protein
VPLDALALGDARESAGVGGRDRDRLERGDRSEVAHGAVHQDVEADVRGRDDERAPARTGGEQGAAPA